ncbi:glucose-1-phosphate adenylyltransferase subunit GlgD [Chloroflexota bacterium]
MENVLAIILAGGLGERLGVLSRERAKPAVPFAGNYRIIDFTLSNCVNSGVSNVIVLTQYQPLSLAEHIGIGVPWGLVPPDKRIRLLQPYLAREQGRDWYKGSADAVYQNIDRIDQKGIDLVLILSGDHVYKMDYSKMFELHQTNQADITLAATPFPEQELFRFGTITLDETNRLTDFQEKVKNPKSNLASMGVYLFKIDALRQWLEDDAESMTSKHDFGKNIFPKIVNKSKIFGYRFEGYWRDVGTIHSYWQTSMDLLETSSKLLSSTDWPIHTNETGNPPTMISDTADVTNSLISNGCIIEGRVEHSVLSPGVRVAKGAVIKDSIIMNDSTIGRDSLIDYCILDKEVIVESDSRIGFGDDFQENRKERKILNTGITIAGKRAHIGRGTTIGRNCIIYDNVTKDNFPGTEIESGGTIKQRGGNTRRKE